MQALSKKIKLIYKSKNAYLFILPSFLFFAVFTLYPVLKGVQLSFLRYNVRPKPSYWVGFSNYIEMFQDPIFLTAVKNTLIYTIFVVLGSCVLALGVALMIFPLSNKLQSFYKSLYYLPGVTSAVIIASQWKWIFHPVYGLLNSFMETFGLEPIPWLGLKQTALPSIIFMDIAKGDGAAILLIMAALNSIPNTIFEAAICDGASKIRILKKITLPLLKPIMLYLIVMSTISSLQVFVPVFMLTRGGPEFATVTVAYEIYKSAFMRMMRFDLAAAQGVILFLATMITSIIYFKLLKDDVSY